MIHHKSHSRQAWWVCLTAALFFFYEFIQLNLPNSIANELMQSFAINATQVGTLSAMYFYANIIFLFFAGAILDRISTRIVILVSLSVCIAGTLLFAQTHSFWWAASARFFTGIGSAFCFLSCMRLATRWFPNRHLALITGLIVTMAFLGGMVAQTPLTLLIQAMNWRSALLWDAGLGLLIALLIAVFVKDFPNDNQQSQQAVLQQVRKLGILQCYRLAFLRKQNWLAGTYTSLLNLPVFILGALWGNSYLEKVQHISRLQAANITALIFLGAMIGAPLAGLLSDRWGKRRSPMLLGAVLSLLVMLTILQLHHFDTWTFSLLFFTLGLVTSTQVISYPTIAELNPRALSATALSVISICAISGGGIFEPLFGWLMDRQNDQTWINHVKLYTAHDYTIAIWMLPIAIIGAFIAACFIHETHCEFQGETVMGTKHG